LELPILRLLRKRVIVVYNGSDSRPPYLDGSIMAPSGGMTTKECIALTKRTKRSVTWTGRWANVVVDQPMHAHFHERPIVMWERLGVPAPAGMPDDTANPGAVPRVLHAASHPEVKGTELVRAAVKRLQSEGAIFEYVELVRQPHQAVLSALARCDIVVDQLFSDTPVAGLATEACAAGKPVIVGGYLWDQLDEAMPSVPLPRTVRTHPDSLSDALATLVGDPSLRRQIGSEARDFVEHNWTAQRVAERYIRLLEGSPPEDWLFRPEALRNVTGVGMTERKASELTASVIRTDGPEALRVRDKPTLEALLVRSSEMAGADG
jgi:hypothetical protein